MTLDPRPIVMLDLNGTVHAYSRGWGREEPLYDPPTEGFKAWASEVQKEFRIVIAPAHMNTPRDFRRIRKWFRRHDLDKLDLELAAESPRGLRLKIDDRAVRFNGSWADFPLEMLRGFKTWSGR